MKQLQFLLKFWGKKKQLKLHLTTKALTFVTPRLGFASFIVGYSGFICNMYTDCLQPGNRAPVSEGGVENYRPLLVAVQTSKALRTLNRQVSAADKAAMQTKDSFSLTEVSPDPG